MCKACLFLPLLPQSRCPQTTSRGGCRHCGAWEPWPQSPPCGLRPSVMLCYPLWSSLTTWLRPEAALQVPHLLWFLLHLEGELLFIWKVLPQSMKGVQTHFSTDVNLSGKSHLISGRLDEVPPLPPKHRELTLSLPVSVLSCALPEGRNDISFTLEVLAPHLQ